MVRSMLTRPTMFTGSDLMVPRPPVFAFVPDSAMGSPSLYPAPTTATFMSRGAT